MTKVGVGASTSRDAQLAGRAAVRAALKSAGLTRCDFVLLFATVGYDQTALLKAARTAAGGAPLAGCSGAGVVVSGQRHESSHAVAAMVWQSSTLRLVHALATEMDADPRAAAEHIAREISPAVSEARMLFVFMDGLSIAGERFLEGLGACLPAGLPVVGGMAADNWRMATSFQYYDDRIVSGGVGAVLLAGEGDTKTSATWTCTPVGRACTVTRSAGATVHELDGVPTLDVLAAYIGDAARDESNLFVSLAIGIIGPDGSVATVRSVQRIHSDTGAIDLCAPLAEGARVIVVRRDGERTSRDADAIARGLVNGGGKPPALVIQVESAARTRGLLTSDVQVQRQTALQNAVGPETPWIGFLSFGEVAQVEGKSMLLNCSTTVSLIA